MGVFDLNVWYRNILEFFFLLVNIYIYGLLMNEKYNELYIYILGVFEYLLIRILLKFNKVKIWINISCNFYIENFNCEIVFYF